MNPEKLTVEEFKVVMNSGYDSIQHIAKINGQLIHVLPKWVLDRIEKGEYNQLQWLSIPTFFMDGSIVRPVYIISGRWTYAYQDGYFIRIGREGRCS